MSAEIQNRLQEIQDLLVRVRDASHFEDQEVRLTEFETAMGEPGFWDDQDNAKKVIQELKVAKAVVDGIRTLQEDLSDAQTLFELGREEEDPSTLKEAEAETRRILREAEHLELTTLLAGEYDANNGFLSIHAGAGGTESCDWAEMLQRMFIRWAERNRFKVELLEELPGEETGVKSVTLRIVGPFAYGYLRSEIGVHRLVRVSPYDARGRRHTSFVSVDLSPEVDDVEIDIDESDLRIDTYRASGAGGQHVNVTDSAVRITHIPTNIVVQCQNERSQHANRNQAMLVLQSRLLQQELKKRDEELAKMTGEKGDIAFGNQIRSYVLHPYKMVKDHRTDVETSNVDEVLDGDLEQFIEAFLRSSAKTKDPSSRAQKEKKE